MLPILDLAMELMDNEYTSGSNSAVEFLPSKQGVAGSNPVSRSRPNSHRLLFLNRLKSDIFELLTVLGTLISDILLVVLDPRIRFEN